MLKIRCNLCSNSIRKVNHKTEFYHIQIVVLVIYFEFFFYTLWKKVNHLVNVKTSILKDWFHFTYLLFLQLLYLFQHLFTLALQKKKSLYSTKTYTEVRVAHPNKILFSCPYFNLLMVSRVEFCVGRSQHHDRFSQIPFLVSSTSSPFILVRWTDNEQN